MTRDVKACFIGSFDPPTIGHLSILTKARDSFGKLVVGVGINPSKKYLFDLEQRASFVKEMIGKDAEVHAFSGLAVEFAREHGATVLIRGIRGTADMDFEFQMAAMNRSLAPEIATFFLPADIESSFLSSSLVKEVGALGADIESYIPKEIQDKVFEKLIHSKK